MRAIHLLLVALLSRTAAAVPLLQLNLQTQLPLPGNPTRFDYQSLDPALGRLFISHMGDGTVVVFDIRTNHVLANLAGFPAATGITVVPSLGRVYVSVTGGRTADGRRQGEIAVVDAATLKVLARIPAGLFPDGSAFVQAQQRLFVSDEMGNAEQVVDTRSNTLLATLPLGGSAGMTAYDPVTGHVLVNVQDRRRIAEIAPDSDKIVGTIALPDSCDNNHSLLLDPAQRLAFIACDGNARLLVLDLDNHTITDIQTVGNEPDVLALDSIRKLLYVASESGILSVFRIERGKLFKLGEDFAGDNAHSVSVDPATGWVYLPVRNVEGRPILKILTFQPQQTP